MSVSSATESGGDFTLEGIAADLSTAGEDTPGLVAMEAAFDMDEASSALFLGAAEDSSLNDRLILALATASAFITRVLQTSPITPTTENGSRTNRLAVSLIASAVKGNISQATLDLQQLVSIMRVVGGSFVLDAVADALANAVLLGEETAIPLAAMVSYLINRASLAPKRRKPYLRGRIEPSSEEGRQGFSPETIPLLDRTIVAGLENSSRFSKVTTQAALAFAARSLASALVRGAKAKKKAS